MDVVLDAYGETKDTSDRIELVSKLIGLLKSRDTNFNSIESKPSALLQFFHNNISETQFEEKNEDHSSDGKKREQLSDLLLKALGHFLCLDALNIGFEESTLVLDVLIKVFNESKRGQSKQLVSWVLSVQSLPVETLKPYFRKLFDILTASMEDGGNNKITVIHNSIRLIGKLLDNMPDEMAVVSEIWIEYILRAYVRVDSKSIRRTVQNSTMQKYQYFRKLSESLHLREYLAGPDNVLDGLTALKESGKGSDFLRAWMFIITIVGDNMLKETGTFNTLLQLIQGYFQDSAPALRAQAHCAWKALVDVIMPDRTENLRGYKLLIAPIASALSPKSPTSPQDRNACFECWSYIIGCLPEESVENPGLFSILVSPVVKTLEYEKDQKRALRVLAMLGSSETFQPMDGLIEQLQPPSLNLALTGNLTIPKAILDISALFHYTESIDELVEMLKLCFHSLNEESVFRCQNIWQGLVKGLGMHIESKIKSETEIETPEGEWLPVKTSIAVMLETILFLSTNPNPSRSFTGLRWMSVIEKMIMAFFEEVPLGTLVQLEFTFEFTDTSSVDTTPATSDGFTDELERKYYPHLFLFACWIKMPVTSGTHREHLKILNSMLELMKNDLVYINTIRELISMLESSDLGSLHDEGTILGTWAEIANTLPSNLGSESDASRHVLLFYMILALPMRVLWHSANPAIPTSEVLIAWDNVFGKSYMAISSSAMDVLQFVEGVCNRAALSMDKRALKFGFGPLIFHSQVLLSIINHLPKLGPRSGIGTGGFSRGSVPTLFSFLSQMLEISYEQASAGEVDTQTLERILKALQVLCMKINNSMDLDALVSSCIPGFSNWITPRKKKQKSPAGNGSIVKLPPIQIDKALDELLSAIKRCRTSPYDSEFLLDMGPLLKNCFVHTRVRGVKNRAISFWQETFGLESTLDYPEELHGPLRAIRENTLISLPGWQVAENRERKTTIQEFSKKIDSQVMSTDISYVSASQDSQSQPAPFLSVSKISKLKTAMKVEADEKNREKSKKEGKNNVEPKKDLDDFPLFDEKGHFVEINSSSNVGKRRKPLTEHQREVLQEKNALSDAINVIETPEISQDALSPREPVLKRKRLSEDLKLPPSKKKTMESSIPVAELDIEKLSSEKLNNFSTTELKQLLLFADELKSKLNDALGERDGDES